MKESNKIKTKTKPWVKPTHTDSSLHSLLSSDSIILHPQSSFSGTLKHNLT